MIFVFLSRSGLPKSRSLVGHFELRAIFFQERLLRKSVRTEERTRVEGEAMRRRLEAQGLIVDGKFVDKPKDQEENPIVQSKTQSINFGFFYFFL